jgi:hypothetical protein
MLVLMVYIHIGIFYRNATRTFKAKIINDCFISDIKLLVSTLRLLSGNQN